MLKDKLDCKNNYEAAQQTLSILQKWYDETQQIEPEEVKFFLQRFLDKSKKNILKIIDASQERSVSKYSFVAKDMEDYVDLYGKSWAYRLSDMEIKHSFIV